MKVLDIDSKPQTINKPSRLQANDYKACLYCVLSYTCSSSNNNSFLSSSYQSNKAIIGFYFCLGLPNIYFNKHIPQCKTIYSICVKINIQILKTENSETSITEATLLRCTPIADI